MKTNTKRIFAFVSYGVFAASFAALLVLYFTGEFEKLPHFTFTLLLLVVASTYVGTAFLLFFNRDRSISKILFAENEYALGSKSLFNNLSTFISKASVLRRAGRNIKKEQYVVAFTASGQRAVRNYNRNSSILELNNKVAQIVEEILDNYALQSKKNKYLSGLDKGTFFIFTVGLNETQVRELIEEIKIAIFKASEEHDYRIWIEPIFGVVKVNKDKFIGEYIDNAIIARNVSERNFETVTIYQESFRRSVSKDDTDQIIEGLANNEFVVYYQPKYDLKLKQFTSSEALVRWNSKKNGLLAPAKFIAAAENAGLIHDIDKFVFKRVCEDIRETKKRGRRLLPVSVNFSLYEFFSTKFLDDILNMLEEYSIDPSLIQIEITETTSMANQFLAVSIIKKLQDKGIKLLMDDFGVGFSNIGNLRKIPFDVIKIDKSFVDNIESDSNAAEICRLLINACKINGFEVVAEGVDNIKQVELLKKFKCDTIQGYYYSKPIPKNEYDKFLLDNPFEAKQKEGRK